MLSRRGEGLRHYLLICFVIKTLHGIPLFSSFIDFVTFFSHSLLFLFLFKLKSPPRKIFLSLRLILRLLQTQTFFSMPNSSQKNTCCASMHIRLTAVMPWRSVVPTIKAFTVWITSADLNTTSGALSEPIRRLKFTSFHFHLREVSSTTLACGPPYQR